MKFLGTKDQRKQSGVYIIRNAINNRIYVGSAKVFTDRYWKHRSTLMTGKHRSPQLQAFVNKYGLDVLSFEVYKVCSPDLIVVTEQDVLDALQPFGKNGFNTFKLAYSPKGFTHSDEAKSKVSQALKGRKHTEEAKKNMSDGMRNRQWTMTEEHRQRISLRHKGKKLSSEARERIQEINKGRKHTEASRQNMSLAHIGNRISEDQKKKQSEYMLKANPFGKLVLNTDTGIYYDSGIQAAKAHGLHAVGLNRKLRGERKNNTPFILV